MIICFKVNGQPQGKARPRFNRKSGTVYTPKTTLDYEAQIRKEFMEYTGFGANTAEYFGRVHGIRKKIGNRWRYDRVKTDEVINKLFDVKED